MVVFFFWRVTKVPLFFIIISKYLAEKYLQIMPSTIFLPLIQKIRKKTLGVFGYLCRPSGATKHINNDSPPLMQWATIVLPLKGHIIRVAGVIWQVNRKTVVPPIELPLIKGCLFFLAPLERPVCSIQCELRYLAP
jgi:hypothetical protein